MIAIGFKTVDVLQEVNSVSLWRFSFAPNKSLFNEFITAVIKSSPCTRLLACEGEKVKNLVRNLGGMNQHHKNMDDK